MCSAGEHLDVGLMKHTAKKSAEPICLLNYSAEIINVHFFKSLHLWQFITQTKKRETLPFNEVGCEISKFMLPTLSH